MRCPRLTELPPPSPSKTGWPWTEGSEQLPGKMPDGSPWPKVSIVTPSYNQGQFIEDTLLSVKGQTYSHIEHIIVDGGSTDCTLDVLRQYEGTYDMQWISEPDRGMYHAINKGLALATGDILAYLNTDDLYFPWSIGTAVALFARQPDIEVVYGDVLSYFEDEGRWRLTFHRDFDPRFYVEIGFLGQPAVLFRRTVYDKLGGFDQTYELAGDQEYWLRAHSEGLDFTHLSEFLAIDRIHNSNLRYARYDQLVQEIDRYRSHYRHVYSLGENCVRNWLGTLMRVILFRRLRLIQFWAANMLRTRSSKWSCLLGSTFFQGVNPGGLVWNTLPRLREHSEIELDLGLMISGFRHV